MIPHILLFKTILHLSKLLNNFLIRIEVRQQHFWWRIFRVCCGSQLKLRIQQTSDFYSSLVISRMITCFKYNRNLQLSVRLLYVILDTGAGTDRDQKWRRRYGAELRGLTIRRQRSVDGGQDGRCWDASWHGTSSSGSGGRSWTYVRHSSVILHHGIEVRVLHCLHGSQPLLVIISSSK